MNLVGQLEFECVPSNQLAFTLPASEDLETVPVMERYGHPVRKFVSDAGWTGRVSSVRPEGDYL